MTLTACSFCNVLMSVCLFFFFAKGEFFNHKVAPFATFSFYSFYFFQEVCSSHMSVQPSTPEPVADPDTSGSDSGRGNSDDGCDARAAGAQRDVRMTSSMSNMRTFATHLSPAPVTNASSLRSCDVDNDENFRTVYARPVNVYKSPPVTSPSELHDDTRSYATAFSPAEPQQTRVYYKNFPTYTTPTPFRPTPLGLKPQQSDTSTFV